MFQFPGYLSRTLCVQMRMTALDSCRVPPFGFRRIVASLLLPVDYRSLARPSSVLSGQASSVRPSLLNQWFLVFSFRDVSN